jgi:hypothetical protein
MQRIIPEAEPGFGPGSVRPGGTDCGSVQKPVFDLFPTKQCNRISAYHHKALFICLKNDAFNSRERPLSDDYRFHNTKRTTKPDSNLFD